MSGLRNAMPIAEHPLHHELQAHRIRHLTQNTLPQHPIPRQHLETQGQ